jgi:hypothetical protein
LGVGSQVVVPCEALDTFGHTSLIHHCEGGGEVITACFDKANAAHKAREQQANGAFHDGGNALKVRCGQMLYRSSRMEELKGKRISTQVLVYEIIPYKAGVEESRSCFVVCQTSLDLHGFAMPSGKCDLVASWQPGD